MKKKVLSAILAGSIVASVAAVGVVSASASAANVGADGQYVAGSDTPTKRVYFAMPEVWRIDDSILPAEMKSFGNAAGIYWWAGTDTAGDNAAYFKNQHEWPAYRMVQDDSVQGSTTLWYADIPADVPTVVFNNYLDGGMDETQPYYTLAKQCKDSACEYIGDGDFDLYDDQEGFWDEMEEAFANEDESVLGSYINNFGDYEYGFGFTMDNMIWVPDLNDVTENELSHRLVYGGNWYFYYGDGTYGTYPTKEAALEKGTVGDLSVEPEPTTPAPTDATAATSSTESTVAPSTTKPAPGQPSTDATSSKDPASKDTASNDNTNKNNDNGAIQTGTASVAAVLLVVLSGAGAAIYFSRKRRSL